MSKTNPVPIQAIVVEDVEVAREGLVALLKRYPSIDVIAQAGNVKNALALIEEHQPELLFLDIHLPGQSAFDLLAQIDYQPKLIFTTAYSDYALKTFDFHTIDYLLKPITRDRLDAAINKLNIAMKPSNDEDTIKSKNTELEQLNMDSRIILRDQDENHMVSLSEVLLFESCKNHTQVYFDDKKLFVHKALSHIEARIPESHFFRINRNQIVNLQKITNIRGSHTTGYEISLSPLICLEVSRRQSIVLKDLISL